MKTLYCAVSYVCNERCLFCPCSERSGALPTIPYESIREAIDRSIDERGVENILLSGGEPTLHPDYFRILEHIVRRGARVSLLTNALRLADREFADRMFAIVNGPELDVTVAFHSHLAERHDFLTQIPGSFEKSLLGVEHMLEHSVRLSVKNNIVNHTYRQLPDFVRWMTARFADEVTLILSNIDINGTAEKNKEHVSVEFRQSMPYLQQALDLVIDQRRMGHKRTVKVLTTPLCLLDPYYWGFVESATQQDIAAYRVPNSDLLWDVSSDSGPLFEACRQCAMRGCCPGTWRSFRNNYDEKILKRITA